MVTNRKVTGRAMSVPAGVGLGTVVSLMITLTGAALIAWLIDTGAAETGMIGYGAMATLLLGAAAGAVAAVLLVKHRKLPVSLATGAAYLVLLLILNALCFGGQYQGAGVTALLVMGGAGSVGILCAGQPYSRRKHNRLRRTG